MGFFRGEPNAVQVFAPVADRAGNVYILQGQRRSPLTTAAFVAKAGAGVASGCALTKGDRFGAMGWVGGGRASSDFTSTGVELRRANRQWYWSGAALVALSSAGDCRFVLDRDPATGTEVLFKAVFPWVNDTPSKTTLVALVQTATDQLPFTIIVDLNANTYTTPRAFEPTNARDLVVHGTGARPKLRESFGVFSFAEGSVKRTEARFYDEDGELTARAPIEGAGELAEYGIRGFLEENDAGLVAGLTDDGRLVEFDRGQGRVRPVSGMKPAGVHLWRGALYLVGEDGGQPVVAPIDDDGSVGAPQPWASSIRIANALGRDLSVDDDRVPPRRATTFPDARPTAPFPLLTEHSSFEWADGATLVTIAGPPSGEGDGAFALLAVAPTGATYP